MPLWSLHTKPKYVPSAQLSNVSATTSGWVQTRADNNTEVLVAIGNLTTKQKPSIVSVTTDKTSYVMGTDLTIVFTLTFNWDILSNATSATKLDFTIAEATLQADYSDKTSNTVEFTYTFPVAPEDLAAILAAGESVDSIALTGFTLAGKYICLDNTDYPVGAGQINFNTATLPSTLAISIENPET